jgi:hypothetical protein
MAAVFFVLWLRPEPAPLGQIVGTLISYGIFLFTLLSEIFMRGLAKRLTRTRGEKWIKELDYVYLTIGVAGVAL